MRATPLVIAMPLLLLSSVADAQGLGRQHEQYGLSGTPKAKACRAKAIGAARTNAGAAAGQNLAAMEGLFRAHYEKCMRV
jgi:hypothetical protein